MSLYTVTSFEDCTKLFAELFRGLGNANDALGRSEGWAEILSKQMMGVTTHLGEQDAKMGMVSRQCDDLAEGQRATAFAITEFNETLARVQNDVVTVKSLGDTIREIRSSVQPAVEMQASWNAFLSDLKTTSRKWIVRAIVGGFFTVLALGIAAWAGIHWQIKTTDMHVMENNQILLNK